MPRPGPRTTPKYSERFKATAVRLSELRGVAVQDVAASLYIHPFMLSRWRKQAREGSIVTKGVEVDKAVQFLKMDRYQGAWKLQVNERFLKRAKLLYGKLPSSPTRETSN